LEEGLYRLKLIYEDCEEKLRKNWKSRRKKRREMVGNN